MWYKIAEMEGGPCMAVNYGMTMPVEGMTEVEVAEAERQAREWLKEYASERQKFFKFPPSCE